MCTLSWTRRADGYDLFFNRDERRTRGRALPPACGLRAGMRFVAPQDADFGGSWLAANERGLALALLNGYAALDTAAVEPPGGFTSRGLLLLSLVDCRTAAEALGRLEGVELGRYRSFRLAVFELAGAGLVASWRGGKLDVEHDAERELPLVSSAFDTDEVVRERRELYRTMGHEATAGWLDRHLGFHASHVPEAGPRSVCMHRPDAETVSFSRVEVGPREVRFHYAARSPCRGLPRGEPVRLDLAR